MPLGDVGEIGIETLTDPMSHAEVYNTMVKLRSGAGWVLGAGGKTDAEATASTIRDFIGLKA